MVTAVPTEVPVVTETPVVTESPTETPTAQPTEEPSETEEPEKTPVPEQEEKQEGIMISYRLMLKIVIGICIILVIMFTAILFLMISKKE